MKKLLNLLYILRACIKILYYRVIVKDLLSDNLFFNLSIYFFYKNKAKSLIKNMSANDNLMEVNLYGVSSGLYFPKELSINQLYQIICELFFYQHWHYYFIPEIKLDSASIVIDCGAAEGLFSLKLAKHVKNIILIEPSKGYNISLKKTFANCNNVEILPYAVGNENRDIMFSNEGKNSKIISNVQNAHDVVKMKRLDDLIPNKGKISYIKADLEGYEQEFLKGATNIISFHRPFLSLAVYHDDNNISEIVELIKSCYNNYRFIKRGIDYKKGNPIILHCIPC